MTSVRPPGDTAWNYLRILPQVKQFLLMDEIAPGIYECVALDGLKSKSTINSNDPPNSFRTRDLFTRHPKNPHFWKYVSRLDDRLTLVNGEKVLPIPIEGRIRQEALVQEAVVFGDGKTVPGLIIVRADAAANLSDEEFLQHIDVCRNGLLRLRNRQLTVSQDVEPHQERPRPRRKARRSWSKHPLRNRQRRCPRPLPPRPPHRSRTRHPRPQTNHSQPNREVLQRPPLPSPSPRPSQKPRHSKHSTPSLPPSHIH